METCGRKRNRWDRKLVRRLYVQGVADTPSALVEASDCVRRVLISGDGFGQGQVRVHNDPMFYTVSNGMTGFSLVAPYTEIHLEPGEALYGAVTAGVNDLYVDLRVEEVFDNVRQLKEFLESLKLRSAVDALVGAVGLVAKLTGRKAA